MKNQQKNVPIVSYTFMSRFNNDMVQLQIYKLVTSSGMAD